MAKPIYDKLLNKFVLHDHPHPVTANTVGVGGSGGSITIKEADGSPTVTGVKTLVVTNGSLTDNGGGQATISTGGGGTPGGSDTQVQFNDSSSFGGDSGLTYNKTTNKLTLDNAAIVPAISGTGLKVGVDMNSGSIQSTNNSAIGFRIGSNLNLLPANGQSAYGAIIESNIDSAAANTYDTVASLQISGPSLADAGAITTGVTLLLTPPANGVNQYSIWIQDDSLGPSAGFTFGATSPDTNLYRIAADVLATDDSLRTAVYLRVGSTSAPSNTTAGDLTFIRGFATSLALTGAITGATSYNGLVVTANTGAITTGTWNGTTIAVANGGTGQTSYTNGQLLIGNTTGNTLAKATLTGTANQVVVTNGTGTITLSTPQDIGTGSTPTFAGITSSGALMPSANDVAALGASGTAWADLFLANGGVINWNAGNVTITNTSSGLLNIAGTWTQSTGNTRLAGYIRVGSTTAPTNTTAGDVTAIRAFIGTNQGDLTVSNAGKITVYNNISTVSGGVPSELATIDSTGLTANVAAATLYVVPASGEGLYRVSAYLVTTTAASVSSTMPNAQVVYTDKDSNTAVTLDVSPILGAAGLGQSGLLTANTVGTVFTGTVVIYVKASTTIQYQTVNYASTAAGMAYALRVKLEAL